MNPHMILLKSRAFFQLSYIILANLSASDGDVWMFKLPGPHMIRPRESSDIRSTRRFVEFNFPRYSEGSFSALLKINYWFNFIANLLHPRFCKAEKTRL